eukprot:scaffold8721_cov80-Phaeocystis_antarctica.AAC.12
MKSELRHSLFPCDQNLGPRELLRIECIDKVLLRFTYKCVRVQEEHPWQCRFAATACLLFAAFNARTHARDQVAQFAPACTTA